ncbi:MAG: hypothetical protein SFY32_17220 [Bacteroidota bacterium]|nr:hypothetical protein [Bacteroidota bacterium]
MTKIKIRNKVTDFLYVLVVLNFSINLVRAQEIIWANKIVKSTIDFEYEGNHSAHIIGMPVLYQGLMNGDIDMATEGYLMFYDERNKKNKIKVGFQKPVKAEQIIMGGVFNQGSIEEVNIFYKGKKEDVYKMVRGSMSKFHNFNVFFEPRMVDAIELVIDHRKINNWNILRGIGLLTTTRLMDLKPNIFAEDEFFNKELVQLGDPSDSCMVFYPRLTPDEKSIYYVKECFNVDDQDIWIAEQDKNGQYTTTYKAPYPLNNEGHNFVASIGANGKFLVLGNTYNTDGSHSGDGVSIAHKGPDGKWQTPVTITIPGWANSHEHSNYFVTSSEDVMLMAFEDTGSVGSADLYVSLQNKVTKQWSIPINLGKTLNTPFVEDYPFLSADGKTLFFASNGYLGFGGLDIYVTKRLDDTWKNWSKPQNLGPLINTKFDEFGLYMTASTKHAFYCTFNEFLTTSRPKIDIYKINVPPTLQLEQKVNLKAMAFGISDLFPVKATVDILNERGDLLSSMVTNPDSGYFEYSFVKGRNYIINIQAEGHYPLTEVISYNEKDTTKYDRKKFQILPLPDFHKPFKISGKIFDDQLVNKIQPEAGQRLDSLSLLLVTNPDIAIGIEAFLKINDEKPIKKVKNQNPQEQLFVNKMKTLKSYLQSKGVQSNRVHIRLHELNQEESKIYEEGLLITFLDADN